ncbi:hypothetical protein ATO6_01235 [Oceanicola sp. 22II-s10i]|nr:hypothetical protein ATO6_01235 [Oceanicola sp. 22II-s10i]
MTPDAYQPHRIFAAPAVPSARTGRLIAGIFCVEFLFAIGLTLFGMVLNAVSPDLALSVFDGDTAAGLLLQLTSFALLAASVGIVLNRLHDRSFMTAIGAPDVAARDLTRAFLAVLAIYFLVEILPPWWSTEELAGHRAPFLWLLMVPLGLIGLLIQTGAEEIFYRGYIQQQLAARFDSPRVWLIVPNLLFAMAHWDNGTTQTESWQYMIWAFFFGLAASDLTARTGTLGAAVGLHLANNAYAFLLFGETDAPDSGLSLFLLPPGGAMPATADGVAGGYVFSFDLFVDLSVVALSWLAARVALRR